MSTPSERGTTRNHDPTLKSAHVMHGRVADARHAIVRPPVGGAVVRGGSVCGLADALV
jgi:hypothetical protein